MYHVQIFKVVYPVQQKYGNKFFFTVNDIVFYRPDLVSMNLQGYLHIRQTLSVLMADWKQE